MGRSSISSADIARALQRATTSRAPEAHTAPPTSSQRTRRAAATRPAEPGQRQSSGHIRIIGGQWRRRLLPVASGAQAPAGLRPTPDRVRETLFNWLGQDLHGWHCVDACAGTGALGLEAASRGAAHVWLIEQHPVLAQQLRQLAAQLCPPGSQPALALPASVLATAPTNTPQIHVCQSDALAALRNMAHPLPHRVDVVFLDPPYTADWYGAAAALARRVVKPHGWLYLEAARPYTDQDTRTWGWQRHRYLHAGAVHAHLLRPIP